MPLANGSHIGSYEILAGIGAGGMGEVYRARDSKLGRDVALKVLPEAFARDAERLSRFQREAKVLASLNHPSIAAIYGLEDSGATHALVMELVDGPTLADRIAAAPIPIDEALRIARQISDALEYAHERAIVHRDLKPANIKVTNDDSVKILDFGLAKALEGDSASIDIANSPTITRMATQAGVLLGTAAYMSPEQAKAKPVDRRADIWAFGCVLYEMLTGKMAFSGETVTDTLASVIKEEPDWSPLPAATPPRVRVLLQRCLQKDPKQRLRDIGDARISLDEVLSGAAPEPSASGIAGAPVPTLFWRRALPWAVAAAFAVAFASLALVYFSEKARATAELMRFEIPKPQGSGDIVFALSPDGRELAFTAPDSGGALRFWVRPLNSLDAHELPGSAVSGSNPPFFWSHDSRYLVFDGGGKLEKIDISGGPAQVLCDVSGLVVGGSWNRDGVIIFGQSPGVIMRVSASGGTATPLTALDPSRGETQHALPWFLPDGKHFVYHRTSTDSAVDGNYIGSIDVAPGKQDPQRLVATQYNAMYVPSNGLNSGYLLYLASDRALMAQPFDAQSFKLTGEPTAIAEHVQGFREFGYFSPSADGKLVYTNAGSVRSEQITSFDREGKMLGTLGQPASYGNFTLSPDGSRAVADIVDARGQISLWTINFSRRTTTRLTFDSFDSVAPIWSPDGSKIIFASNRNGAYDIYEKPSDGSGSETLLFRSVANKGPWAVSHDGRFLIYEVADPATARSDLWVLPLGGAKQPYLLHKTQANESEARLSPNDRWVAYTSDQSGRDEVYVRPFSPNANGAAASVEGAQWQVSYEGGHMPTWGNDGKEMYYLTPDGKVMEVAVTTDPVFQAGTPKFLFQPPTHAASLAPGYTVDGKRFVFLAPAEQTGQPRSAFNVMLNWQAALKQSQ
ncbi:MAG TPA: protein kinase [Candidatus Acidoferrales bacterium]|jgi:Tol biopolymer transport system component|nr:protein kinase [Candidatus Acidoferrales bacterium]